MKVLVVDDTASNRKVLRAVLEAEGVTVEVADDGVRALKALDREKFDAVISDILMPRMDGYRLSREIRRNPRLCHLPIIAYTSTYLSPSDEKLALRSGADRYLRKPAPGELLLHTLTELLQPGGAIRPASLPPDDPFVMDEYNAVLVRKLEEKSLELGERNEQLRLANEQLRALTARNESIREHEPTTIAREIHDVLAQDLTSLKIDLVWLAKRAPKSHRRPDACGDGGPDWRCGCAGRRHDHDRAAHRDGAAASHPRQSRAAGGSRVAGRRFRAADGPSAANQPSRWFALKRRPPFDGL